LRYSFYHQKIKLPLSLANCNNINPDFLNTFPTPNKLNTGGALNAPNPLPVDNTLGQTDCYKDGEASLAVRKELAQGPVNTSLVGYTLNYNTLDNNRNRPRASSPNSSRILPALAATYSTSARPPT